MKAIHMGRKVINNLYNVISNEHSEEKPCAPNQATNLHRCTRFLLTPSLWSALFVRNDIYFYGSPNQFIADTPDIDDLHIRINLQVAAQLGNENVQAPGVEKIVVAPDIFKNSLPVDRFAFVLAKQLQDIAFSCRQWPAIDTLMNKIFC